MENGQKEVSAGIELAKEARDAFEQIINGAETVGNQIEEIAAATEEQSSTSEQISQNVESISTVSQQNAESNHEIAEAATELQEVSTSAREMIEQFKLDANGATTTQPASETPQPESKGRHQFDEESSNGQVPSRGEPVPA